MRAKIDNTEGELVENFSCARNERIGSRTYGGEDSLRSEGEEKSGDWNDDKVWPFLVTDESENEENKESDGVGVDCATGKGEEEGGGEKNSAD